MVCFCTVLHMPWLDDQREVCVCGGAVIKRGGARFGIGYNFVVHYCNKF